MKAALMAQALRLWYAMPTQRLKSWRAAIPMGIGGGLGCLAAMRLHKRMRK